jgi:hypothetical protein
MSKQNINADIQQRLEFSTKVAGVLVLGFLVAAVALVGFTLYAPDNFASGFTEVSPSKPFVTVVDDLFGTTTNVTPSGDPTPGGQTQFLSLVPLIKDARQQRRLLVDQTKTAIDASLLDVLTAINATNFSVAMLGWESAYQVVQGARTQRDWVEQEFTNEVIDVQEVLDIVGTRLRSMKQGLFELDRELLEVVHLDSSLIPERFIDFTPMGDELRNSAMAAIDSTISSASYAPLETIGGAVVSALAGFVAEHVTRENGAVTSKGEATLGTQRLAAGAGFATGIGVDYAVKELFSSAPSLKQAIENTLKGSLDRLRLQGPQSYLWQVPIDEYVRYQQSAVEAAVMDAVGVSPEWANLQLQ